MNINSLQFHKHRVEIKPHKVALKTNSENDQQYC
jgi:hypothetical protein